MRRRLTVAGPAVPATTSAPHRLCQGAVWHDQPVTEDQIIEFVARLPDFDSHGRAAQRQPRLPGKTRHPRDGSDPHRERWDFYVDRFAREYADGTDLEGEARFVDVLAPRAARVLDAGCGTGRITAALHRMGHFVIGADRDAWSRWPSRRTGIQARRSWRPIC